MSFGRGLLVCLCSLPCLVAGTAGAASPNILRYAGATTLQYHFMPEAAQAFETATGIRCNISGGNTDAGLQALLAGRIDLAGSGRFLSAAEKAAGLREHLLGWDALVVVVNPTNPVANLSRQQLRAIFAGRIRNWKEVGGRDLPILVTAPPPGSGVRAALQQLILGPETLVSSAAISLIVADSDQPAVQWPGAIGALSLSLIDANAVRTLQVDGVAPTAEQIAGGRYPLLKPLLLVTRRQASAAVEQFVTFAVGPDGQRLLSKHFFPTRPH